MSLSEQIRAFISESVHPALFAGAGASVAAGLPTWEGLLKQLAEQLGTHDALVRQVMRERIHQRNYLNAADQFFLCPGIDKKERLTWLREALSPVDCHALEVFPRLPFDFYVTTNYDVCLQNAWAAVHSATPNPVNIDDPSIKQALWEQEFYIARIHGRAELPETIRLSSSHYDALLGNEEYHDFLNHCFTRTQLLFVGFSFLDPAINLVLDIVDKKVGNYHDGTHLALLPRSADPALISKLQQLRIRTVQYDDSNNHEELWTSLEAAASRPTTATTKKQNDPFLTARKYLSACYARLRLSDELVPLRETVVQGMVSHIIEKSSKSGTSRSSIVNTIASDLGIPNDLAQNLTDASLAELSKNGHITQRGRVFIGSAEPGTHLTSDDAIRTLSDALCDRIVVREGIKANDLFREFSENLLHKLVLQRGWDLGAAFAAQKPPESIDIDALLKQARTEIKLGHQFPAAAVRRVVYDLLTNPTDEESYLLSVLGKASFALELITHSPHDILFHRESLPQKIYLDTNVLMPALTEGHPLYETYNTTLTNLSTAAARSNGNVKALTMHGFLNEVISHRSLAIQEIEGATHSQIDDIERETLLLGSQNTNVYIGAYITIRENRKDFSFMDFLRAKAPYRTESDLQSWIAKKGISTVSISDAKFANPNYSAILHKLERAYSSQLASRHKTATLISHDAAQLAMLEKDIQDGVRALFVTADKNLTRIVREMGICGLSNHIISHTGLVQLVDLLIGTDSNCRGGSQLMWSTKISDQAVQIQNHLVNAALREYYQALDLGIIKLIDEISEDAAMALAKEKLELSSKNPSEQKRALKILGTFENRFFEKLREAMDHGE